MWKPFKVKVEALTPESFAPFGQVIGRYEERKPEVRKGGYTENAYTVTAGLPPDADPKKVSLIGGRQRAHFAFHTDAGQSFYPSRHCPTVFLVAPVQPKIEAKDLRAFYSDGSAGVCLGIEVWHTMPICIAGEEVYQTTRGDQDYKAHSVEIDFDLEQGLAIDLDEGSLDACMKRPLRRLGFQMKIKPERVAEYKLNHSRIPQELLEALRRSGWHNYTLFMRPDGYVFGYFESPHDFKTALEKFTKEMETVSKEKKDAGGGSMTESPDPARPDQWIIELEDVFYLA
jgi:L-rhamnose mutarotase